MTDALKIAVKTALIAVITAGVLAIFANIQLPALDFTLLTQGLGVSLAVLYHYIPISRTIMPIAFAMLSIQLAILVFKVGAIAWKWIFKVNE